MVSLVFCDILQLPHTVISNSEKLTHPTVQLGYTQGLSKRFLMQKLIRYAESSYTGRTVQYSVYRGRPLYKHILTL